ncbi:MAG: META domain-containing protein [Rhodobacteraceae bacterium]|nr:META domain-containing protein [Paracoccaceae bacterium]
MKRSFLPVVLALISGFIAMPAASAASELRQIRAEIMVLERIALPDDTMILAELSDMNDNPVASLRRPTDGAQSPFAVSLEAPSGQDLILRAGLRGLDDVLWLAEPVMLPAGDDDIELAGLRALRTERMGAAAVLQCGNQLLELGTLPDELRLRFNEQTLQLTQSEAASGTLYVAPDNPATQLHMKGDEGILRIDGAELAPCRLIAPEIALSDSVWNVTSIDGKATIFPSRTELVFYPDGRFSATVGCNRLIGSYRRHGAVLSIGRMASTMMACPDGLQQQERLFTDALQRVDGYKIDAEAGRVVLMAGGQPLISARK